MQTIVIEREKTVSLRISKDEYARWTAAAEAEDRTLSSWLRVIANAAAGEAKPTTTKRGGRA